MLLCLSTGQLATAAGRFPPVSHHIGALSLLISPDGKQAMGPACTQNRLVKHKHQCVRITSLFCQLHLMSRLASQAA